MRVRLPHGRDGRGVLEMARRLGVDTPELGLLRALRFDPRTRAVLCATVWTPAGETVVGLGAITYGSKEPDLLLADDVLAPGLGDALRSILAEATGHRRAA